MRGWTTFCTGATSGSRWILAELERVAPVTAVGGNTDDPALRYAPVRTIELAGRKFFIQHIVRPHDLEEDLQQRLARERPDVVVFGHTHKRFCETLDGILYLNPGYAGQPKFGSGPERGHFRTVTGRDPRGIS